MEDQQLVIRILTGIKEAVAAEILSYMDSETAARLTMEMAP
jgi:flagellar motility protein MotE (MotC chaperone)